MKKKAPARSKAIPAKSVSSPSVETSFSEVVDLINAARHRTYQTINTGLMELYWQIGEYISRKLQTAEWGDGVVDELARYLARTQPGLKGFTRRNLFRMRQFCETYRTDEKVSALLTQLSWTHHLSIMTAAKRPEEREFYMRMAVQERWTSRELDRQIKGALFERAVLNPAEVSAAVAQTHTERSRVGRKHPCCAEVVGAHTQGRPAVIADLKPYPAMKDSGMPWLGEVPEHWEVKPNRALFEEIKDQNHPDEPLLSATISKGVIRQ